MVACIALLATGLWACDGGGGTDAGPGDSGPRPDGGPGPVDSGPEDAGTDAGPDGGPPPIQNFQVRLVNNVPGVPGLETGTSGLEVCLYGSFAGSILRSEWLTQSIGAVPFRGVSPYRELELVEGLDFVVAMYRPGDLREPPEGIAMGCPADPFNDPMRIPCDSDIDCTEAGTCGASNLCEGSLPNRAVVLETIEYTELRNGGRYSGIATGYGRGTFGAPAGAFPTTPCGGAECPNATVLVIEDDLTPPAEGRAHLRVSHQIANLPVSVNLCYDSTIAPTTTRGVCMAPMAGSTPVALIEGVSYTEVTPYVPIDPIQPNIVMVGDMPVPLGALYLAVAGGEGADPCPPYDPATQGCYPILPAFPVSPGADNIRPNVNAGDISTVFISGSFGDTQFPPAFFVWQDNYVAPAP